MLNSPQIINGRYQLRQQLGQNAGRQTWLAEDLETQPQELVVVKLLAFSPQMQWEEFRLFEREAQILQHLDHPKIPRYRDYFSIEETESELPWFGLVQQYIPGLSLRQRLDQGHSFSEAEAQKIATDILTILIYLHELSPPVLHRDIKPSNLIVDEQGQVYLVDFGAVQDRAKAEGATFTVVGTSGYAAPEQLWGRAVAASDLYSLGATLIHLVTGIAPADLPQQNLRLQFADRVNLNPRFSYWLEKLIDPATEQRFSSARQALEALTAAFDPEASTNQQPISPVAVFSVIAVLIAVVAGGIAVVAGGIGIYFPIANSLKNQQVNVNESEAKMYLGAMNRAQQAYRLENNEFANSIEDLGLGIKTKTDHYNTDNYTYSTRPSTINTPPPVTRIDNKSGHFLFKHEKNQASSSLSSHQVVNYAISRQDNLRSYVGFVFYSISTEAMEVTTFAILCKADNPGTIYPAIPNYETGHLVCAAGTTREGSMSSL
ncbi:protein kinase domain-containing protein [Coleofasciculus chthonoplastes]|uniref:protein kinase domain-containing protein n=1 Tax=Coleofasciculus chthonoplastes TaxID=64178 RepID=UPI0032F6A63F